LQWRDRGLTVHQETGFPDEDVTRLRFEGGAPQNFSLLLRQPAWCETMSVAVNGRRAATARKPGSYHRLSRRFRAGDVVEIRLPMRLTIEALPNAPEYGALLFGPIVLAGRLGTEGLAPGSQLIVNERESGKMLQAEVQLPEWRKPLGDLVTHTARTNPQKLEFRASGFAGGASVDLIPWFRLTHERYNLYWHASV
jgi:DUF1680 family protein